MDTRPGIDFLTYLDADLWFFDDPELVFKEIGDASIAITPHRLTPKMQYLARFGKYNVGWVSWRNDEEGRRCLRDYRADCLDWCFDRPESNRFADQKYLDKWPSTYANLRILDHPGINAAEWNVDVYDLIFDEDRVSLSGHPLIFWHFQGVKKKEDGTWKVPGMEFQIYTPYLNALEDARDLLAAKFDITEFDKRDIRRDADKPRASDLSGMGDHRPGGGKDLPGGYRRLTEAEARQAVAQGAVDGWHWEKVAQAQAQAYATLIEDMKRGRPRRDLATAAEVVKALGLSRPSLLDVGCGSGYYRSVFDHLVPGGVEYQGIDYSPAMIALAREQDPNGAFTVADAANLPYATNSFDIVFNGVSLMHILDFEAAIQEAARVARRYVVFHTAVLRQGGEAIFLTKDAYGGPVVEVVLSEAELRRLLSEAGLAVIGIAPSIEYDLSAVLGERTATKTLICAPVDAMTQRRPSLLNLGCGGHFHPAWVNIDIQSHHPGVMAYDILNGLPFPDAVFDMVYHSHMLEHLPGWQAEPFMAECARVLKPGGILRVAIPDLETICRLYLESLSGALDGDRAAEHRYDWMLIELIDQISRVESGGEMARYWREVPPEGERFVIERVGDIAASVIAAAKEGRLPPAAPRRVIPVEEVVHFRKQGEVHQWMYDRFSLGRLMRRVGLEDARVVDATESAHLGFARFRLDTDQSGQVRKPDSLFMEAVRR
ncbi:methyltransferase domain-containing protein [Rhodospirillum sp. A1_3_36]|uniref:methyltransferase domain-containing protein n=1 Tax=Rhodospirillum sp. A1_3_36 TaxID=3391666 RepID=UPI0039A72843